MEEMMIDGLIVEPNQSPYDITIVKDKDLIEFHITDFFDGECNVEIMKIADNVCIIYNSLAKNLNRKVCNKLIYGNFYIVGIDKSNRLVSLSNNIKKLYANLFDCGLLLN